MKQRVISACVGLLLLAVALFFFDTLVFNAAIALIVTLAVYEVLHAAGCSRVRPLLAAACIYGGSIPFIPHARAASIYPLFTFCYIAVLFLILLRRHETLRAEKIGFTFFISAALPYALTVSIYMRDKYGSPVACFLILLALAGAWTSDTGAYFVGRAFGKHPLSPKISPKKTVEGAVGGVVVCTLCILLISLCYQALSVPAFGVRVQVNLPLAVLAAPFVSVAGMLGDLSASVIKRQNGVKDYGNIMPGHGGVMDRFDSVFFTAPTVFMLAQWLTLASV